MRKATATVDCEIFRGSFPREICRSCSIASCKNNPKNKLDFKASFRQDASNCDSISEEVRLVARYLSGELEHQIFQTPLQSYVNFEKTVPFIFLPQDRKYHRENIWARIEPLGKATLLRCRAAIIHSSKLLIAEYTLNFWLTDQKPVNKSWILCYENQLKRLTDLLKDDLRPITRMAITNEIESVKAKLQSLKPKDIDYVEELLKINHILYEGFRKWDSNAFEAQNRLLAFSRKPRRFLEYMSTLVSKSASINGSPRHGKPKDTIINTFILIILIFLHDTHLKRNSAEEVTAELINEYCYHNPILTPIVKKERSREDITEVYKLSDISRLHELFTKKMRSA
jgi:hypothetical protein